MLTALTLRTSDQVQFQKRQQDRESLVVGSRHSSSELLSSDAGSLYRSGSGLIGEGFSRSPQQ